MHISQKNLTVDSNMDLDWSEVSITISEAPMHGILKVGGIRTNEFSYTDLLAGVVC